MPLWWNWQTRWTQNPVVAIPCRFDPDQRHQNGAPCQASHFGAVQRSEIFFRPRARRRNCFEVSCPLPLSADDALAQQDQRNGALSGVPFWRRAEERNILSTPREETEIFSDSTKLIAFVRAGNWRGFILLKTNADDGAATNSELLNTAAFKAILPLKTAKNVKKENSSQFGKNFCKYIAKFYIFLHLC